MCKKLKLKKVRRKWVHWEIKIKDLIRKNAGIA